MEIATEVITRTMLEPTWQERVGDQFDQAYMKQLKAFLRSEKDQKKIIYPKGADIFNAFALTPFDKVKVVILGQDPYHGPNQAHGLCFSVQEGITPPPSLVNIYKELQNDLGISPAKHGSLLHWATQGVFLLNSVLTVEKSKPASHQKKGWETFTDSVIQALNQAPHPIVFLLWGAYAQKKGQLINTEKHFVIKGAHPSPFSAHQGFFGGKYFSKANQFLEQSGQTPIDWHV